MILVEGSLGWVLADVVIDYETRIRTLARCTATSDDKRWSASEADVVLVARCAVGNAT